jgi:hypothetical protein
MSGSDKPKSNRSKSPPHEPSLQETAPYREPSTGYGPTPQESPAPHQSYPQEPPRYPAPPAKPLQIPAGRGAHPYAVLTRDIANFAGDGADSFGGVPRDGMLGPTVTSALQKVLGWKPNGKDPKGFMNALNQSFSLTVFEGYVRSQWTPRSYAVQTDLSGGIAGAQASIYTMAKTILDQALPLLSGLYPLKPDFDAEYVSVLQQTAASQLTSLVVELGYLGGPRIMRVNQYFRVLMGIPVNANGSLPPGQVEFWKDPDQVTGTLGFLRKALGLGAVTSTYVNNVADEQDVTNFRIIVDYVNAIFNSWQNSLQYFTTMQSPFLGTQLVWISRQLSVVNETVEEVRFVLDSVFIGRAERETLAMTCLVDGCGNELPSVTLEELLSMIQSLMTQEGPEIIQTGGKFAIGEDFSQMVQQLQDYVSAAITFAEAQTFSALNTDRVLVALYKLQRQLEELRNTASAVGITTLPPPSALANASQ